MIKILTPLVACSFATLLVAQCDYTIPGNALVLDANGALPASNQSVWVCGGLTSAQVTGSSNTIAVEANTVFSITGAENVIYLKDGCVIVLNGFGNEVYLAPTAQVLQGATGNNLNNCTTVTYDDSGAPANGCANVGIEEASPVELTYYPNPVTDELFLGLGDGVTMEQVRVIDLGGRVVRTLAGAPTLRIDLSDVQAGTYLLVVETDRGQLLRRFTKR